MKHWSLLSTGTYVLWFQIKAVLVSHSTDNFPMHSSRALLSCALLVERGGDSTDFAHLQFDWFVTFL